MPLAWLGVLWLVGAYLVGSLSPGDLIARAAGVDIRKRGDGNPGAHNVWREIGPIHGSAVFVLDFATGVLATGPLWLFGAPVWLRLVAVIAVLAGHIFPVFWRFQGGVGGAVGLGTTVGLLPAGALLALPGTALAVLLTRSAMYAVWLFFGLTLLAGWLWHRDALGVVAVLLAMSLPTAKWVVRYRIRSVPDVQRWLRHARL